MGILCLPFVEDSVAEDSLDQLFVEFESYLTNPDDFIQPNYLESEVLPQETTLEGLGFENNRATHLDECRNVCETMRATLRNVAHITEGERNKQEETIDGHMKYVHQKSAKIINWWQRFCELFDKNVVVVDAMKGWLTMQATSCPSERFFFPRLDLLRPRNELG